MSGIDIVLFGTLRDPKLLSIVLGRVADLQPVRLEGHGVFVALGETYPLLLPDPAHVAEGVLLEGLSAQDIARLDYYEAPYDYTLTPITLSDGRAAQVYRPAQTAKAGQLWSLAHWQRETGPMTRTAAQEIMELFGTLTVDELRPRLGPIRTRAQARVNAASTTPSVVLRQGFTRSDVAEHTKLRPYSKFFAVDELDLTHRRFDGGEARVERAVFVMADAVVILPYDPVRDVVLLIEQFRVGPYLRGDTSPWSLEAVAGRIDGGETPEQAGRREAREEAGLELADLLPVADYYPSPGAATEYLYCYVGIADLPGSLAGVSGLDSEDEDIRSMVVGFDALMDAVRRGEVQNGPLLVCSMWLERERETLRAGSTAP